MTSVPRRVRLTPEARRAQLIASALTQISERGYNGFTLSRLAADCGITRAGVEHYFPDAASLLVAVLEHRDDLDLEAVTSTALRGFTGAEVAWRGLDALVERNAQQPELVRLYALLEAESLHPDHPAHDYFIDRTRNALAALTNLAADWHPDPPSFAAVVLALLDGLQLQWLREPGSDLLDLWYRAASLIGRPARTTLE
ncbi:TetR/AcrR family transcriptional regulator [Microbacterium sp. RURRCA19A]|uniref:TetR/AcrR family transcriptional regulator n=1 Tax=Microbacterium sp. RURRCA19A TaxID=1907391 RepID=UPI00097028AB|nr:TetR/AcrR family transcriptional regulator [Microbacterium sp. RURRCA19A]